MGQPDVLTYTEFLSQLPSGSIVACDPKLMGAKTWITLKEKLSEVGVNLTSLSQNLIDEVWTEDNGRPPANVRFAKFSWFFVRIPFGIFLRIPLPFAKFPIGEVKYLVLMICSLDSQISNYFYQNCCLFDLLKTDFCFSIKIYKKEKSKY